MATAKPKRMMFGGIAKGAMDSVKKAVAAKTAPMKMQNAARSAAQQAAPQKVPAYAQPYVNKMQGAAAKMPIGSGRIAKGAPKMMGGMMKKGGAVKKATKK